MGPWAGAGKAICLVGGTQRCTTLAETVAMSARPYRPVIAR